MQGPDTASEGRRKKLSVVTPCFNEEGNVEELYRRVAAEAEKLAPYEHEHIFIDNASTDRTVELLKAIAARDKRVKIIVNSRNFGHIRSPFHGLLAATGDAVILMAADLQDPPELLPRFVEKWEQGSKIVVGVRTGSDEARPMYLVRRLYYRIIGALSDVELIENFTGSGLYDTQIIQELRKVRDPYPYFRGLICDIGFERARVEFHQPVRRRGLTHNNFYTLLDMAMLGLTNHSKVPLRLMTVLGFLTGCASLLAGLVYFAYKLLFWNSFSVGMAPVVIGMFFLASMQFFFLGIVGEYVGAVHTQVLDRPLVVEKERINFD